MNNFIDEIYQNGMVLGRSGNPHKLHSSIDKNEGEFLAAIISSDESIVNTLEVGCGYGLSSLFIACSISDRPGARHVIIDPFQNSQWDAVGVENLKRLGADFCNLVELKSEFALPKILYDEGCAFDFIFIDGFHTFDHTLLDCYYATRLLKVGGVLAIDDVSFPSIRRVVDFLSNYPCYEFLGEVVRPTSSLVGGVMAKLLSIRCFRNLLSLALSSKLYRSALERFGARMVALRKISEDKRQWFWHKDSF